MNKKSIIGIFVGIVIFAILAAASFGKSPNLFNATANIQNFQNKTIDQGYPLRLKSVEKIEVVHFHSTQQCWSCITVGEYSLETITDRFSEEYKSGTIVFKDINVELPENRDVVMRYRAGGSALFINAISSGLDNIEEDTAVWRLVSNEQQFLDYFETKIKKLLGKQ